MNTQNKFCRSCGMPMSKDPQGGGTNADGNKNENIAVIAIKTERLRSTEQ